MRRNPYCALLLCYDWTMLGEGLTQQEIHLWSYQCHGLAMEAVARVLLIKLQHVIQFVGFLQASVQQHT